MGKIAAFQDLTISLACICVFNEYGLALLYVVLLKKINLGGRMRTFLFVLLCLLSSAASANQEAVQEAAASCAKDGFKPMACFRMYANLQFTAASLGVDIGLSSGKKEFPGVARALENQERFYELALSQVKDDAAKTKAIQQFHVYWKDNMAAILPKAGQPEAARKADVAKRKAELAERVEKLPTDK